MPIRRYGIQMMLALLVQNAFAADDSGVNAYRPTVSNPATLPTPGQLELEFGGLHVKTGGARNDSLPYLLKLGFSAQWGVLVGGDAYLRARDDQGNRASGIGDTTVTAKHAILINDATAYGFELGAKLPTAKPALGSGKTDFMLTGIVSRDFGKLHMDTNLGATRLGGPDDGTARMQIGLSSALSLQLSSNWTGMAELSGVRHGGTPTTAQLLAAVSYSPGRRYAIDVGLARGINAASQDWSFFTGLVIPVAKLW